MNIRYPIYEGVYRILTKEKAGDIRRKEKDPTSGCPFFHAPTGRITTVSG